MQENAERCENVLGDVGEFRGKAFAPCSRENEMSEGSLVMRCDRCAFWAKVATDYGDGALLAARECSRAIEIWEATEWNDDYERVVKAGFEDVKMFVADGSGYSARLLTRADFFCAHFKGDP